MARRIEVELTSERDDNTWTWRAAGARQPKGVLDGSILYPGAKVGDVVRAEAEFDVDGITVVSVLPPKEERKGPERLELIAPGRDFEPVTTTLAPRGRGDGRDRRRERRREDGDRDGRPSRPGDRDGDRRPRGDRPHRPGGDRAPGDRAPGDRAPGDRPGGDRRERTGRPDRPSRPGAGPGGGPGERPVGDRQDRRARPAGGERRPRPERPAPEPKPKPKRLRAGRTHRSAVLAELPPEQRPVAEQLLSGGIPAVRQALERQNEQLRSEGKPEVKTDALLAMAEELHPKLRSAEWRDRAEAALADVDEIDLRDLRSVVVAADDAARDEETRDLASRLRASLNTRVDREQGEWQAELAATLADGRIVRALRLSSRPPKAGVPLPADVVAKLTEQANAALTAEISQDRWAAVLDAVAYSPVRRTVEPLGVPPEPGEELLAAVRKVADRIPQIAARFGIEVQARPARPPRPGRPQRPPTGVGAPRRPGPPRAPRPPAPPPTPGVAPGEHAAEAAAAPAPDTDAAPSEQTTDTAAAGTGASTSADVGPAAPDAADDSAAPAADASTSGEAGSAEPDAADDSAVAAADASVSDDEVARDAGDAVEQGAGDEQAVDVAGGGGDTVEQGAGGGEAVDAGVGGGDAVDAGVGGGDAVDAGVGGGDAVDAGVGGGDAVEQSAGGGDVVEQSVGDGDAVDQTAGGGDGAAEPDGESSDAGGDGGERVPQPGEG